MGDTDGSEAGPSLLVEQHGAVRRITLNRPEKLNAIDAAMEAAFFDEVEAAMADELVSVLVIAGSGRAFCSGADLRRSEPDDDPTPANIRNAPVDMVANRRRVENWLRLWAAPKPLIAQVHGYCIGIANEIVGACDLIVCGDSTKMGMPEVRDIALPPTLGFWPARLGLPLTKELLFTGRWMSGSEAVARGLASQVVPDDELAATVDALAAQIAEVPVARLSVVKQAVNAWAEEAGWRSAALRGADYHAIYHQASEWGVAPLDDGPPS